jgi:hypothetical protein
MYMVNTDAWDFDTLAALVAPKALLVENTDADPIFPVPGIRRIFDTLETVYKWYDASDRLGLVIGEGGHKDTVEIRHPSFAFMNTWLKGEPTDPSDIEEPDRKIPIEELKVLDVDEPIPADALNARIDETFVPEAEAPPVPDSAEEWESLKSTWLEQLRSEVFGGWPSEEEVTPLEEKLVSAAEWDRVMIRRIAFTSQEDVRLDLWMLSDESGREQPSRVNLIVLPDELARPMVAALGPVTEGEDVPEGSMEPGDWLSHYRLIAGEEDPTAPLFLACPRGTGTTAWSEAKETHIRRRFALIGQTLDGMRVWDLRRAIAAVGELPGLAGVPVHLTAAEAEAPIALWAAVFEPKVAAVRLQSLPASYREGPIFLNLDRILEPSQVLGLLYPRPVTVDDATDPAAYDWASQLAEALGHDGAWPRVAD